jgi:hypothetical protein
MKRRMMLPALANGAVFSVGTTNVVHIEGSIKRQ